MPPPESRRERRRRKAALAESRFAVASERLTELATHRRRVRLDQRRDNFAAAVADQEVDEQHDVLNDRRRDLGEAA
jgi:hypothetical protein